MSRPEKERVIQNIPEAILFGPRENAAQVDPESAVVMKLDEFEALRLADFEGLYQKHGAEHMHVSRQTFGNILASARRKVAEALILKKELLIEGGHVIEGPQLFHCSRCRYSWKVPLFSEEENPQECPACHSQEILREEPRNACCGPYRKRGFRQRRGRNAFLPPEE